MLSATCHVCSSQRAESLALAPIIPRISSDATPWPTRPDLAWCPECSTITTVVTPDWRHQCNALYSRYRLFEQSENLDQTVFDREGMPVARAMRVLEAAGPALANVQAPILDFGCGTGALLASIHGMFPATPLMGLDFDESGRAAILDLPGVVGFHTSWSDIKDGTLGAVLMTHVLEHLENPLGTLSQVRSVLVPNGILVIQVPDVAANPYMLAVGDHAIHFDSASLLRLVAAAGFEVLTFSDGVVAGELTVVATPGSSGMITDPPLRHSTLESAKGLVLTLESVVSWLIDLTSGDGPWGIFGTSIAGTWAAEVTDDFNFWVDEDPARVGRQWRGRPILAPSSVNMGARVAVVLAPVKANSLLARASGGSFPGLYLKPPHH